MTERLKTVRQRPNALSHKYVSVIQRFPSLIVSQTGSLTVTVNVSMQHYKIIEFSSLSLEAVIGSNWSQLFGEKESALVNICTLSICLTAWCGPLGIFPRGPFSSLMHETRS